MLEQSAFIEQIRTSDIPARVNNGLKEYFDRHYNPADIREFEAAFDRIENAFSDPETQRKFHDGIRPWLTRGAYFTETAATVWDILDADRGRRIAQWDFRNPRYAATDLHESLSPPVWETRTPRARLHAIISRIPGIRGVRRSILQNTPDRYAFVPPPEFMTEETPPAAAPQARNSVADRIGYGMAVLNTGRVLVDAFVTPRRQIVKLAARGMGAAGERIIRKFS